MGEYVKSPTRLPVILAVEVSTKPFINLVWLGAIVMLGSVFMSVGRRVIDLKRPAAAAPTA